MCLAPPGLGVAATLAERAGRHAGVGPGRNGLQWAEDFLTIGFAGRFTSPSRSGRDA